MSRLLDDGCIRRITVPPPDIVLLVTDWKIRAPLRAQLIEDGFDVIATDTWETMRRHLRPGSKPRLGIVDLQGLPEPDRVLAEMRVLMKPEQVVVVAALGTLQPDEIDRYGFRVVKRPLRIGDIVAAAAHAMSRSLRAANGSD